MVVTNLLNEAMPFVRYVQGDLASIDTRCDCNVKWKCLRSLDGRLNDAFITRDRRVIASGTILDITYRMMFDRGLSVDEFMLVQVEYTRVLLYIRHSTASPTHTNTLREKVTALLEIAMQQKVDVEVIQTEQLPYSESGKRRPIRRSFLSK